jgi:FAD/FMN-containing dehydrogenase
MRDAPYQSFGRLDRRTRPALDARDAIALLRAGKAPRDGLLGFGGGLSYGDSCHNDAGLLADMRGHARILSFDPATGILEAEAGARLCDVIAHAAPSGFFPPVVPGTQFVTLGGAIANDIHGKNHHRRGSFGCHVLSVHLLRSDGQEHVCSPRNNPALFRATIGGMGLTGLITRASIRLMRVPSPCVRQQVRPFRSLAEYFEMAVEADRDNEYAVAWVDQLASGRTTGRGLLIVGNHADTGGQAPARPRRRLSVPFDLPLALVNRPFMRMFNEAYRIANTRAAADRIVDHRAFFFPLDAVGAWNRLYGPAGLFQHQSVLPTEAAPAAVGELLAAAREAGEASFLTVLKRFGTQVSPALLSFPRSGFTLTLDFANRGSRTRALLDRLDAITLGAGGAVNPYKDARMSAETFAASFPRWPELEAVRDPAFMSDFWARTARVLAARAGAHAHAAE